MGLAVCYNGVFRGLNTFAGTTVALASVIRASSNQWFHVMAVWIYAIAGDIIVSCHRQVSARLLCMTTGHKSLEHSCNERLGDFLRCMDELVDIAKTMTGRLAPMLLANVFSSLLFTLTFTFRAIENVKKQEVIPSIWDVSDVMDASIRFWVVAHTADRLRSVVIKLLSSIDNNMNTKYAICRASNTSRRFRFFATLATTIECAASKYVKEFSFIKTDF